MQERIMTLDDVTTSTNVTSQLVDAGGGATFGGGETVCRPAENSTSGPYDIICNGPHLFDAPAHVVFIYAYVTPLLVAVTLVTNLLVCVVLLRSTRSPTNVLLVAMAVSDTLTGAWPVPVFIHFYAAGRHADWLPYSWCFAYFCLTDHLPTVFHTASIWLTVSLAVQRYVSVCHPLLGKRLCTVRNVLNAIALIYALSLVTHLCRFVELVYHPVPLTSRVDPARKVTGCYDTQAPLVVAHADAYYNTYYWFRVVFIHVVPCTSLVLLNAILIQTMRAAQRRRSLLLRQNRRVESRRLEESNSTTLMLVTVVGLFLLVEVPLAVFFLAYIWDNTFRETSAIQKQTVEAVSMAINLCILLSYPLNFFIYCGMSRQFRETFQRLFFPCWGALGAGHTGGSLAGTGGASMAGAAGCGTKGGRKASAGANNDEIKHGRSQVGTGQLFGGSHKGSMVEGRGGASLMKGAGDEAKV